MAYGLTEKEIAMIKAVFEKTPEVESVFVYGSRAKNTYKKTSDIDLAVVLKSGSDGKSFWKSTTCLADNICQHCPT